MDPDTTNQPVTTPPVMPADQPVGVSPAMPTTDQPASDVNQPVGVSPAMPTTDQPEIPTTPVEPPVEPQMPEPVATEVPPTATTV